MDREFVAALILAEYERTQCSLRVAMKKTRQLGITDWKEHSAIHALVFETVRRRNAIDRCLHARLPKGASLPKNYLIKNLLRVAMYRVVFEGHPLPLVHNTVKKILDADLATFSYQDSQREREMAKNVLVNMTSDALEHVLNSISDSVERMAVEYYHPTWLVRDLVKMFGENFTKELMTANNKPLPRFIRLNILKDVDETIELLQEEKVELQQDPSLPEMYKVVSTEKPLPRLSSYKTGRYYLQDRGSAIIANVVNPEPGELVIDACAAPGGKTTHMAMLMRDKGHLIAIDKHSRRLEELNRNVREQEFTNVEIRQLDLLEPLEEEDVADKILGDAPCSGLGTFPQMPDTKWRNTRQKLRKLARVQLKILENVSRALVTGGILVYATCSIHPIENEDVIREFLGRHSEFELVDQHPFLGVASPFMEKVQRLYPHLTETEGFTIFKMKKNS